MLVHKLETFPTLLEIFAIRKFLKIILLNFNNPLKTLYKKKRLCTSKKLTPHCGQCSENKI